MDVRYRVVRDQSGRPYGLQEVDPDRERRVRRAGRQRQRRRIHDRADALLRRERERHRGDGQRDKRDLVDDGAFNSTSAAVESPQRPQVEQQQDGGKRRDDRFREEAGRKGDERQHVAARTAAPHVGGVGPNAQHPEQSAEHVLACRDPGDGLDVQRMDREQRGDEGARSRLARHPLQDEEQCHRRKDVDRQTGQVVRARVQAGSLHVRHVREPGQRSAGGVVRVRKGPTHGIGAQSAGDVGVLHDELAIVIVDEVEGAYFGEGEGGSDRNGKGEQRLTHAPVSPNRPGILPPGASKKPDSEAPILCA